MRFIFTKVDANTSTLSIGGSGSALYFGTGEGTTSLGDGRVRGAVAAGTNIAGATLYIDASNGTGTGGSGAIIFETVSGGGSSSSTITLVDRLHITTAGNTGIGRTSPINTLDISGSASLSATLTIGQGGTLRPQYGPLSLAYKSSLNGWTTAVTIQDTTGNVGIGSTSPTSALDVNGTINATTFGIAAANLVTASCTHPCTATASCAAGKNVIFGMKATAVKTCDTNPNNCTAYCTPGSSSCAATSTVTGATVSIWCAKTN